MMKAGSDMNRSTILEMLTERSREIRDRYGVELLALFGSAARDELRPESDIDILVTFGGRVTYARYFDLKSYLEQLLGRPVDLVTERGLKPRARSFVEKDLIRVA